MKGGAKFYGMDVKPAYNHTTVYNGAGKGGICIWIPSKIVHLIKDSGNNVGGYVQWVKFTNTPGEMWVFLISMRHTRQLKDVLYGLNLWQPYPKSAIG